jgi:hypothetical protein
MNRARLHHLATLEVEPTAPKSHMLAPDKVVCLEPVFTIVLLPEVERAAPESHMLAPDKVVCLEPDFTIVLLQRRTFETFEAVSGFRGKNLIVNPESRFLHDVSKYLVMLALLASDHMLQV